MASEKRRFLHQTFNVKCPDGNFRPKDIRITKLYLGIDVNGTGELFMLTMQGIMEDSN